jgi:hypothetical protein
VFCSFLALVLEQELESRIKQADLQWEWKEVIRGLDALQQVEANFQGRRFLFRSQLTADASQAGALSARNKQSSAPADSTDISKV